MEGAETRTTPAVNPGADLIRAFKVKEVHVEEVPPVAEEPVVTSGSEPIATADSPTIGRVTKRGPRERFSTAADGRGSQYFKPARQNSYELAHEAENENGSDHPMTSPSTPEIPADRIEITDYHKRSKFLVYLAQIVSTWQFESFFAVLIACHAVLLGAQIEWECLNLDQQLPMELVATNVIFNTVFLLEIILRITAYWPGQFFAGPARGWNSVDFGLVPRFKCPKPARTMLL